MPTIRSQFSLDQFEKVLQQLAHKIAIQAVTELKAYLEIKTNNDYSAYSYMSQAKSEDKVKIKFAVVDTKQYSFYFQGSTLTYHEKGPTSYSDGWGFEAESKKYATSSDITKISFYTPEGEEKKTAEKIRLFIEKIMADAGETLKPRFNIDEHMKQNPKITEFARTKHQ